MASGLYKYPGYRKVHYVGGRCVRGFSEANGLCALLDCDTKEPITPPMYTRILMETVEAESFRVKIGEYVGAIDAKGEPLADVVYDFIGIPCCGIRIYIKKGKYGLMTRDFKEIIPPLYDELLFDNAILIGKLNGLKYVVSYSGEKISKGYLEIGSFVTSTKYDTHFAIVMAETGYQGLINKKGRETIPCRYDMISHITFHGYMSVVRTPDGLYNVVDHDAGGKHLLKGEYVGVVEKDSCLYLKTKQGTYKRCRLS